jgi:hypothetical protein
MLRYLWYVPWPSLWFGAVYRILSREVAENCVTTGMA